MLKALENNSGSSFRQHRPRTIPEKRKSHSFKRVFDRKQVESGSPLAQALIADFIMEVKEKLEKFKKGITKF
jgi:hypothetical protein